MDDVIGLINHLLDSKNSIDTIDSIVHHSNISKNNLLRLIQNDQYKDYFQLLRPANNRNQIPEKIALTLDLFCCTHYAQQCKNQSCPFLHLCPYNIRPMHTKCTNKTCPFDHDLLKSVHNRKIIEARNLSFIPTRILQELTRASADPQRSFWVCNDHGKKNGCAKKSRCDKLHFCYYFLTDSCTKPHCQHVINEACLAYFQNKELTEHEHEDILNTFRKVLRQRKPDYVNVSNMSYQPSRTSTASASPNMDNQRVGAVGSGSDPTCSNVNKSTGDQQRRTPSSASRRSIPISSATAISLYDTELSSKSDLPSPLPEHTQDVLLLDSYDKNDYAQVEYYLSNEIGCPLKLLTSKNIFSETKESKSSNIRSPPVYYYCPTTKSTDIFRLLRWQHEQNRFKEPLIVYASVRDAHDATEQNFENNQFCIFRVHLLYSGVINGDLLPENRLQLNDPSTICFDRMWVYVYNLS